MKNKSKKIILSLMMIVVLTMAGSTTAFANTDGDALIIAATDGAVETPAPEEEPESPTIIIQNYPASLEVGEKARLSYALNHSDTNDITWKSSEPDILSIDADGNITAIAAGTAKITVSADGANDSVKITVKEISAESIKIVSDDFSITDTVTGHKINKGDTVKLSVESSPKNSTVSGIDWEVDDDEIAEIDSGGTLIALKNGKVKVTASANDGDLTAEIEIQTGSSIPWVLIAIIAVIVIIIIVLISLIIRKNRRRGAKPKKSRKYDDDDDEYEDDDDPDENEDKKKQEELEKEKERIRQEAYRQGFSDRDKEMTKVFDPKDFEIKNDDDIE